MKKDYSQTLGDLKLGNVIPVYPKVSKALKSLTASVLFSQILYYVGAFKKMTFNKTDAEICQETALSLDELKAARKKLIEKKIISVQRKGLPCKMYYTINRDAIAELLEACFEEEHIPPQQTVSGNSTNLSVENPLTLLNKHNNNIINNINNINNINKEGEIENFVSNHIVSKNKKQFQSKNKNQFQPPKIEEVYQMALERGLTCEQAKFQARDFIDYYESVGWVRGKGQNVKPIVSWKGAFSGWLNRSAQWQQQKSQSQTGTTRTEDYNEIAEMTIKSLLLK